MTTVTKRKKSFLKIPAIVLAVVVVALFASAAYQISDRAHGYWNDYDARDYLYPAESGRFDDLFDTAVRDMRKDSDYGPETSEYRALAFYYEQAVLEHAYRATGDDAKADAFAARMDEYAAQLGSLSGRAKAVKEAVS